MQHDAIRPPLTNCEAFELHPTSPQPQTNPPSHHTLSRTHEFFKQSSKVGEHTTAADRVTIVLIIFSLIGIGDGGCGVRHSGRSN